MIRKFFIKVALPHNPRSGQFVANAMMHAAMQMIDKPPRLVSDNGQWIEESQIVKSIERLRPRGASDRVVVQIIDANVKAFPESAKELYVAR